MTKKKKAIGIIVIVAFILIISNILYVLVAPYVYFNNKYGSEYDFKFVSYKPAHFYSYDGGFLFSAHDKAVSKWVYECDGVEFQLQKIDKQFVDDYQLEKISDLCTQFLKNSVDNRITGIMVTTEMIVETNNIMQNNLVWDENNILEFLRYQPSLTIYYEGEDGAINLEMIEQVLSENNIFKNDISLCKLGDNEKLERYDYGYCENGNYMIQYYAD